MRLGGLLFLAVVLIELAQTHPWILAVGGIGVVIIIQIFASASTAADASMRKKVQSVTDEHIQVLARKRAQTLRADGYGNFITDRWRKEIDYFFRQRSLTKASSLRTRRFAEA